VNICGKTGLQLLNHRVPLVQSWEGQGWELGVANLKGDKAVRMHRFCV